MTIVNKVSAEESLALRVQQNLSKRQIGGIRKVVGGASIVVSVSPFLKLHFQLLRMVLLKIRKTKF